MGSQNNIDADTGGVLKLCFQSKRPQNSVEVCTSYLHSMVGDYPITFAGAFIRSGRMVLTFASCESAYSYALKVLAAHDWKQPLKIDDMLLSTFSVGQYMFKNILRLGMVDSTPCTEATRDAVREAVTNSSVGSKVRVGLCSVRGEIFVFTDNAQHKKICSDVSIRLTDLKILPTRLKKCMQKHRKRKFAEMDSRDLCTKYLKFAEAKTTSVLADANKAISSFDPYAEEDEYEKATDNLKRLSQHMNKEIVDRKFSQRVEEPSLSEWHAELREKIQTALKRSKNAIESTLQDEIALYSELQTKMHAMDALDNDRRSGDLASSLPKDIVEKIQDQVSAVDGTEICSVLRARYFIARLEAALDNTAVGLPNLHISTCSEALHKNLLLIEGALHQDAVRRATSDKREWYLCDELRKVAIQLRVNLQ